MGFIKTYALMRGGRIYTLKPYKKYNVLTGKVDKSPFRYVAYCDGECCGMFRSKKDFELFVSREPDFTPIGPHAQDAARAACWSTFEGMTILQKLIDRPKR